MSLALALLVLEGVYVNGSGPYRFLVDTGAASTVLSPVTARQLGLSPTYRVEVATVNGVTLAPAAKVTSVTAGRHTSWNAEVLWYPMPVKGVDGILGQSFLKHFAVLLDYRSRTVTLSPATPASGIRVPLEWDHGRPAVRIDGNLYVLDSGANSVILFRPVAEWRRGQMRFPFYSCPVPAALSPAHRHGIAGLLPPGLFESVYLDPRNGYAILSPQTESAACNIALAYPTL